MFKKLIGPVTVLSLALFGCGQAEETADTTQTDTTEVTQNDTSQAESSSVQDPNDIIAGIKEDSGSEDERPAVELDFSSGVAWEESSYAATPADGTITITGNVLAEDPKLFLVQDGEVTEEITLNEAGEFEYTTEAPAEDTTVYFVADNRLEVGQTDVNVEEADRAEEIVLKSE